MPPAFNLSQDQTLQFDLEITAQRIEVNFTCMKIQFSERLRSRRPRHLSMPWHSPSNAHAYRLFIFKELSLFSDADVSSAQKRDYELVFKPCQSLGFSAASPLSGRAALSEDKAAISRAMDCSTCFLTFASPSRTAIVSPLWRRLRRRVRRAGCRPAGSVASRCRSVPDASRSCAAPSATTAS